MAVRILCRVSRRSGSSRCHRIGRVGIGFSGSLVHCSFTAITRGFGRLVLLSCCALDLSDIGIDLRPLLLPAQTSI